MKGWMGIVAAAALGAGVVAFSGSAASARIICNEEGDCWHAQEGFVIAPGLHLAVHPDNWHWQDDHRYHLREHDGRGYWAHGEWRGF